MKSKPTSMFAVAAIAAITFSLAVRAQAQTETELYTFTGVNGGEFPASGVTFDSAGNIYGTTLAGGNSTNCSGGCGTVFRLSPTTSGHWKKTILHYFPGGKVGSFPVGAVVFDSAGNIYGAAYYGGTTTACNGSSCGMVYKLTPTATGLWKESTLYEFAGGVTGGQPSGIFRDAAGNLYGAASAGGNANDCKKSGGIQGCGLVFKLSPSSSGWKETILYTFTGGTDGQSPFGNVIFDAAGNLYGTTQYGGGSTNCGVFGCGMVFELSPTTTGAWTETKLYSFTNGPDGGFPNGGVIFDASGNLYGSNLLGGANSGSTIFEISPSTSGSWTETTLYQFNGSNQGMYNSPPLVFDSAGNLWGENIAGASTGCGTIFEMSPISGGGWSVQIPITFTCMADGGFPEGGLTFDAQGNLYGTASSMNPPSTNVGVVFKIAP